MTILVTGASGHLGRLVVDSLLARGAKPAELIAGARSPEKLADLVAAGVSTVAIDYDDPATLTSALGGVDRVLLVSGSEVGKRVSQHQNVIDAAAAAGVELLAYTSLVRADSSTLPLAPDHLATEQAIAASGVPAVILRNNWYAENYLPDLDRARETGVLAASGGDGKVTPASRRDYADAAAVVLLGDGHAGQVYELAG
ncbi:NAD(P)H-binding protein, partial [Kribbia dieselivorans]|uniref:NAD(P)H-binding protein n=1 Tax=Kribbia dieselivorans TaxID=331526 RepID=UPI000838C689